MSRFLANLYPQARNLVSALNSTVTKVNNPIRFESLRHFGVTSGLSSCYPQIQKPAPQFEGTAVVNKDFKDIKLSDYKGKYVVLFFYPLDFTFVCPTELIAFSEKIKEFHSLQTEVIGVSTDSQYSHLAWINTPKKLGGLGGDLGYPLLSDFNKKISTDYNVLVENAGIAFRGLFVIDREGILRQLTVNDLPIGRNIDETLRVIRALQFVEKHGEVCPANWQPDSKTIKPNPKDSKEYFESVN
ncbi:peroxiredoxin 1-like [Leptopilina heterotoma]|uniref:peroxiredoxin 1-like n=1 Tax=Leptopilina heterotoma TaxID=63436 RepID=UPI001CA95398|nr:peroxiredoxin 1-like [Leptopilina heterotoma]